MRDYRDKTRRMWKKQGKKGPIVNSWLPQLIQSSGKGPSRASSIGRSPFPDDLC